MDCIHCAPKCDDYHVGKPPRAIYTSCLVCTVEIKRCARHGEVCSECCKWYVEDTSKVKQQCSQCKHSYLAFAPLAMCKRCRRREEKLQAAREAERLLDPATQCMLCDRPLKKRTRYGVCNTCTRLRVCDDPESGELNEYPCMGEGGKCVFSTYLALKPTSTQMCQYHSQVVSFGKYNGHYYGDVANDTPYWTWCKKEKEKGNLRIRLHLWNGFILFI